MKGPILKMECYATDLTLGFGFVFISLYDYFSIFLSPALHYRARGRGITITGKVVQEDYFTCKLKR